MKPEDKRRIKDTLIDLAKEDPTIEFYCGGVASYFELDSPAVLEYLYELVEQGYLEDCSETKCSRCDYLNKIKELEYYEDNTGFYQQYKCKECGDTNVAKLQDLYIKFRFSSKYIDWMKKPKKSFREMMKGEI